MFTEEMTYLRSYKATDWGKPSLLARILFPISKRFSSNPEYEKAYPYIAEWLIEFGEDEMPDREIALNEAGASILAGPNEHNYDYWLDTNMKIGDFENEVVEKIYFESKWKEFHAKET